MRKVAADDARAAPSDGIDRRALGDALGTTDVALSRYVVPAGERISGLHAHGDQEEVFVVLHGTVTFERLDGTVSVERRHAVRFAPGEFQSAKNGSTDRAVVLAIGAPPETDDVRVPVGCSSCEHGEMQLSFPDGRESLVCPVCGAETEPECPECGGGELRAILGEDEDREGPVNVCVDCGARWPAR